MLAFPYIDRLDNFSPSPVRIAFSVDVEDSFSNYAISFVKSEERLVSQIAFLCFRFESSIF